MEHDLADQLAVELLTDITDQQAAGWDSVATYVYLRDRLKELVTFVPLPLPAPHHTARFVLLRALLLLAVGLFISGCATRAKCIVQTMPVTLADGTHSEWHMTVCGTGGAKVRGGAPKAR